MIRNSTRASTTATTTTSSSRGSRQFRNSSPNININVNVPNVLLDVGRRTSRFATSLSPFHQSKTHSHNHQDLHGDAAAAAAALEEASSSSSSESHVSMSSSSSAGDELGASVRRRQSRHMGGLSTSMVALNKSNAVQRSKYMIFGVLVVIATLVITFTYLTLQRQDRQSFERGFEILSLEMLHRVRVKASHMETTFASLANGGITGYTSKHSNTIHWPNVTVPYWQARAIHNLPLTLAVVLGMSPFVSANTSASEWQDYSKTHAPLWMQDSLMYQQLLVRNLQNSLTGTTTPTTPTTALQQVEVDTETDTDTDTTINSNTNTTINDFVYHLDPRTGLPIPPGETDQNQNDQLRLPVWQLAPAPRYNATVVNFDMYNQSVMAQALQLIQSNANSNSNATSSSSAGQPVLTPAFSQIEMLWKGSLPPINQPQEQPSQQQQQQQQPYSLFLQPIWDYDPTTINKLHSSSSSQQEQEILLPPPNLVGILHAVIPWNSFMERTLANPDIRGLCVVMDWVSNTNCDDELSLPHIYPTFTFRVDGMQATFVGFGDLHETAYDGMMESMDFIVPALSQQYHDNNNNNNQQLDTDTNTNTNTSAPICSTNYLGLGYYQWRVYPSQELQATNYSPSNVQAWLYSAAVVVIFCLATLIFLSYDYLVQARQKAVLDSAIRSNQIVTSLFPSNVRDRIMKDAEEQAELEYQQKRQARKMRRKRNRKIRNKKALKNEADATLANALKEASAASNADPFGAVPKNKLKDFLNEDDGGNNRNGSGNANSHNNNQENDIDEAYDGLQNGAFGGKPIADLFPAATVLFADIVGFTAWSSVREPTQVFQLLETLYHHFDAMANRRRVFKVETIGDCYVAVTGLPDPRPDHAIVMARFAKDILTKMKDLCQRLEVILGPDTGDLCLRVGLHSGAVTAGVLRGEKSRFQLFGDTVNTAARMESTGAPNKIQMSTDTAKLLQAAGKKWAKKREDMVEAKGKGKMQTYWLAIGRSVDRRLSGGFNLDAPDDHGTRASPMNRKNSLNMFTQSTGRKSSLNNLLHSVTVRKSVSMMQRTPPGSRKNSLNPAVPLDHESARRSSNHAAALAQASAHTKKVVTENTKKTERLVRWNVEVLSRMLRQIEARRKAVNDLRKNDSNNNESNSEPKTDTTENSDTTERGSEGSSDLDSSDDDSAGEFGDEVKTTVLEEVKEIIHLPTFDAEAARNQDDPSQIQLDAEVRAQLLDYVGEVASMYRYNPFHNFEHASHVTMSVVKLLSRIVPDAILDSKGSASGDQLVKNLHDHTYGITSDPLTQFAVVFSALIHDLDHPGVPNATLVKEGTSLATLYKNKSVAEQNSVDLAWEVLMGDRYKELRKAIYSTKAEKKRFRQLIVNAVMATDIVDQELKNLRNARWDKAFAEKTLQSESEVRDDVNRKATIVIEHLLQASDVAHTMQHWHIYRKWNERFFEEMYNAFLEERSDTDPSDFWYQGEIGFFDFYIIPLAKKLKDCGVFGVASDEYLNYAKKNRQEWEIKGQEVVKSYLEKYGGGSTSSGGNHNNSSMIFAPRDTNLLGNTRMMDASEKLLGELLDDGDDDEDDDSITIYS